MTSDAKLQLNNGDNAPWVSSSWTHVLIDALQDSGIDGYALADSVGLNVNQLRNPNSRLRVELTAAFWLAAVEATGDDALGLWVPRYLKPTSFHALGFAVLASSNLLDAFRRMDKYSEVTGNTGRIRIEMTGQTCECHLDSRQHIYQSSAPSNDAIFSSIIHFVRKATDKYQSPSSVELVRARPKNHKAFEKFYTCPIQFGAERNCLHFDRDFVERSFLAANPDLAKQQDALCSEYIASFMPDTFRKKLRKIMIKQLPLGDMSINILSKSMGVSTRSLQRSLDATGKSYSEHLISERRSLAKYYLEKTQLPLIEICFLLGYKNTSSFSRAFKSWTGISPKQYVETLMSANPRVLE